MAELQDITSQDWSLSMTTPGEVVEGLDDIGQCIAIIISTQKGSDPLRPDFGVDLMSYIDLPVNRVIPVLTADVIRQITTYEPRVKLLSVEGKLVGDSTVNLAVTWKLNNLGPVTQTETLQL